jgi:hypothetical protein
VPPDIGAKKDPDAAMAWKFSISKEQYLAMEMQS